MKNNLNQIVFTPNDGAAALRPEARIRLKLETEDFLHAIYDEAATDIGTALTGQKSKGRADRWTPIARSSTLSLLSHLVDDCPGEALTAGELVVGTQTAMDMRKFMIVSGLQTEQDVQKALEQTAKSVVNSGLVESQVALMFHGQVGTLETAAR